MAEIAFSRPKGRVRVFFPDEMSLDELRDDLMNHIAVATLAKGKPHNPPETGRMKSTLGEP